jgi:hypothetical protein
MVTFTGVFREARAAEREGRKTDATEGNDSPRRGMVTADRVSDGFAASAARTN